MRALESWPYDLPNWAFVEESSNLHFVVFVVGGENGFLMALFLMSLLSLLGQPHGPPPVSKTCPRHSFFSSVFSTFSLRNGPHSRKGVHPATRIVMCHRCGTKANTTTHTMSISFALKYTGHSRKHVVRDGINRMRSLWSECACLMRTRLKIHAACEPASLTNEWIGSR